MSAPSLSLFSPPAEPTLLELYSIHWEHLRGKGTRACDLEALRNFDRLHPQLSADKLTFDHCRRFRRELDERIKLRKISRNSANKLGRHLNRFLALLGPNDGSIDPEDPLALQPLGILPAPLRLAVPPKESREVDDWIEIEESAVFLAAATQAKWVNPTTGRPMLTVRAARRPPALSAPHWFQAVWLFLYNSALRIEEATLVKWSDRYADKHGEWLHVRPEVGKTGERHVYLNRFALTALDQLKLADRETILGWDYSLSYLDRMRRQIYDRANLHRLLEMEIGWHGLRKACATELGKTGGLDIAAKHLGHVLKTVTAKHYLHRSVVIPHVDRLPQPAVAELPPAKPGDDSRQLKLFE